MLQGWHFGEFVLKKWLNCLVVVVDPLFLLTPFSRSALCVCVNLAIGCGGSNLNMCFFLSCWCIQIWIVCMVWLFLSSALYWSHSACRHDWPHSLYMFHSLFDVYCRHSRDLCAWISSLLRSPLCLDFQSILAWLEGTCMLSAIFVCDRLVVFAVAVVLLLSHVPLPACVVYAPSLNHSIAPV